MTDISVVIPTYRSGEIVPALFDRLRPVLDALTGDWEVIFVDDASGDGTYAALEALRAQDQRVKLVRFARNTGQHQATLYGLRRATGRHVVTMDDDLQNPPEQLAGFIDILERGTHDLVIGRIQGPKRHGRLRNLGSQFVQRLAGRILGKPPELALSSYRGMTSRVASAMSSYTGTDAYIPALMLDSVPVERICNVDVTHDERASGTSQYTAGRLVALVSYLLVNHSLLPLRFVTTWGFVLSGLSIAYALYVFGRAMVVGIPVPGFASVAVLVAFLSGNVILFIGILGEYVGRLVRQQAQRVQFPVFEEHF